MRFPWLFALLLLAGLAALVLSIWRQWRGAESSPLWVANTEYLRRLPAFLKERSRTRMAFAASAVALVVSLLALSTVAGAPVDRRIENEALASRDLVLCLDASGSMLPYDGAILTEMEEMVERFSGERLSLQMWSGQSIIKFPLTDDYDLVGDVLSHAAGVIDHGYMGQEGEYVLVTPELSKYLEGVDADGDEPISSLVGDGLASCVLGFDHREQDRSRTVILATDNEVMGPQIYDLKQAVQFARAQDVQIIALYPARGGVLTAEGEQLLRVVEGAGGSFFQADDPGAVDGIMNDIESQQVAETLGSSRVLETDRPRTPLVWAVWAGLFGLMVVGWRRL